MHLLLDVDGVLQFERSDLQSHIVQTCEWEGDHAAFRAALFSDVQYHAALRGKCDLRDVLDRLLRNNQIAVNADAYLRVWTSDFSLNYELINVLADLQCQSVSLASNQERYRGGSIRSAYEPHRHLSLAFLSCEIGYRKPETEFFSTVLGLLDADPKDVVFIDDVLENVQAAKSLGIHSIQFQSNQQVCEKLRQLGMLVSRD